MVYFLPEVALFINFYNLSLSTYADGFNCSELRLLFSWIFFFVTPSVVHLYIISLSIDLERVNILVLKFFISDMNQK